MCLERPANYRGPGTRNITATANIHATKGFWRPALKPYWHNFQEMKMKRQDKKKDSSHRAASGDTGSCASYHSWAHSRFEPSKLKSHFRRCMALSILARGESVPVPVSVPVTFTCIESVPRLLNCVLRYIPFAGPAPGGSALCSS